MLQRHWLTGLIALFALGVAVGWWTGHEGEGGADDFAARDLGEIAPAEGEGKQSLAEGLRGIDRSADALEILRRARAEREQAIPRVDLLRLLARFSPDPKAMVGVVVDAMSEEELAASLASFTDISSEKITNSDEPRALAHRLAELAMEGFLDFSNQDAAGMENVSFSEGGTAEPLSTSEVGKFGGDGRIRATFPMGTYKGDEVFVKWTRLDDPKIMLFNHYPIRPSSAHNYVWLEPEDGWDAGEYQVNFYTADDTLTPLSWGRYQIE